jgi:hypothetical protein
MPEGKLILRNCFVEVDGVDLSNRFSAATIETPTDEVDVSSFGGGFHEIDRGLRDATITLSAFQDHSAGSVDDVFNPLNDSGDEFLIRIRPDKGAVQSATNPERRMIGKLYGYNPIAGSVGEASTTDITIRNASDAGVTRHPS